MHIRTYLHAHVGTIGLNLALKPYKDRVCGLAANAALVQLQATYIIALAFYVEEDSAASAAASGSAVGGVGGYLLIVLNILSFLLFLLYLLRSSVAAVADLGTMVTAL